MSDVPAQHPWWVDKPISDPSADQLDRLQFAERVRWLVERVGESAESTVIGLIGPWGSGKSSTLELIVSGLAEPWRVRRINPWALADPAAVVSEVLTAVASAFPDKPHEGLKNALRRYGSRAAPLMKLVPVVGDAFAEGASKILDETGPDRTLTQEADGLNKQLQQTNRRVLVVIDDVDRLHADELLALFKAVRVLGRLSHVYYLLAYDELTLLDVLSGTAIAHGDRGRALAFLDKVVTLRVDQPPTLLEHSTSLFAAGFDQVLADHDVRLGQAVGVRLAEERAFLLRHGLREPRAVNRFLTQLRIYLPLLSVDEVDFVDLIVLTYLRIARPDLYRQLGEDRSWLTGAQNGAGGGPPDAGESDRWRTVDGNVRLGIRPDSDASLLAALTRLFPRIGSENITADELRARSYDRRASSIEYVDKYFALGTPRSQISDTRLRQALGEWVDGSPQEAATELAGLLSDGARDTTAAGAVRRAAGITAGLPDANIPTLARKVFDLTAGLAPRLPEYEVFGELVDWLAQLFLRLDQPSLETFTDFVTTEPVRVTLLVRVLRMLDTLPSTSASAGLPQLLIHSGEAAWSAFVEHCRRGEDIGLVSSTALVEWAETQASFPEVTNRLRALVDAGQIGFLTLAGRFVEATSTGSSGVSPGRFDADAFVDRFRRPAVAQHETQLEAAVDSTLSRTPGVLSWSEREQAAAGAILDVLRARTSPSLPDLPQPDDATFVSVRNSSQSYDRHPAVHPDLTITLTIGVPAVPVRPPRMVRKSPDELTAFHQFLLDGLTVPSAMRRLCPNDTSWDLEASEPTRMSAVLTGLPAPPANDKPSGTPERSTDGTNGFSYAVDCSLQIHPGTGPHQVTVPALMLQVTVAVWSPPRSPDDEAVQAKLSMQELVELLADLLDLQESARTAAANLLVDVDAEPGTEDQAVVLLGLEAGNVATVLTFSDAQQVGKSPGGHIITPALLRHDDLQIGRGPLTGRLVAARAINDWLTGCGYRGVETGLAMMARNGDEAEQRTVSNYR